MPTREQVIEAAALAVGFARVGAAPLAPLPRAAFLAQWLAEGRAGEMHYLAERTDARIDPRTEFAWARSIVVAALRYPPPPPPDPAWRVRLTGRLAAYAGGVDYHERVAAMLDAMAARLRAAFPAARFLAYVDTGPLLERDWAARAGLGWTGKHTLTLDRADGSYFLLGELLTDLELEAAPPVPDLCGGCTRCVAACPTDALDGRHVMDPRRCISYLTIEQRGPIPTALRPLLDNWIFGCDLCQQACPWNGDAATSWSHELTPHLPGLLALDDAAFRARYRRTAVWRTKRAGLLRNAAVALGNSGNPDAVSPLAAALAQDPAPLVRGHVAWALGRLGGAAARRALEHARKREIDAWAADEIAAALA